MEGSFCRIQHRQGRRRWGPRSWNNMCFAKRIRRAYRMYQWLNDCKQSSRKYNWQGCKEAGGTCHCYRSMKRYCLDIWSKGRKCSHHPAIHSKDRSKVEHYWCGKRLRFCKSRKNRWQLGPKRELRTVRRLQTRKSSLFFWLLFKVSEREKDREGIVVWSKNSSQTWKLSVYVEISFSFFFPSFASFFFCNMYVCFWQMLRSAFLSCCHFWTFPFLQFSTLQHQKNLYSCSALTVKQAAVMIPNETNQLFVRFRIEVIVQLSRTLQVEISRGIHEDLKLVPSD